MNLVDLHLHGAFGVDVLTARDTDLDRLSLGLASRGVAGFVPTLVPLGLSDLAATVERLSAWIRSRAEGDGRGAMPLGIHFEGPFVSPARAGALRPARLLDGQDRRKVDAFLEAAGDVPGRPVVTLAPEVPGGLDLVSLFAKRGWLVFIGHTDASFATLDEALARGARHLTHFCNAMRPLHHRDPGAIGWGLLRDGVTVDLGDGSWRKPEGVRVVTSAVGDGSWGTGGDGGPASVAQVSYPIDSEIRGEDGSFYFLD
ncbi:hypothetical protein FBQ97_21915, partial [Acidobacteria bacterium ACD]|nr:hypothetical protein [Acidobacteria bacterium ACD]